MVFADSGSNALPVQMAIEAKQRGLTTVWLGSLKYARIAPLSVVGKKLFEVVDYVIDNGGTPGDAMLDVEGLEYPICPASGMGAAAVLWGVCAGIVEEMLARGLTPTVLPSVNRPDGWTIVRKAEAEALRKGY